MPVLLNHSKELEQILLILLWNSYTIVFHTYLQELLVIILNNINCDLNLSILGKFQGIRLQTEEYLHNSLLVCSDNGFILDILIEVKQLWNVVVQGFSLLNLHYLIHDRDNIKVTDVFPESSSLNLSEVKKVLDNVGQDAGRRLLDQVTIV
jgi:hypothetical protein